MILQMKKRTKEENQEMIVKESHQKKVLVVQDKILLTKIKVLGGDKKDLRSPSKTIQKIANITVMILKLRIHQMIEMIQDLKETRVLIREIDVTSQLRDIKNAGHLQIPQGGTMLEIAQDLQDKTLETKNLRDKIPLIETPKVDVKKKNLLKRIQGEDMTPQIMRQQQSLQDKIQGTRDIQDRILLIETTKVDVNRDTNLLKGIESVDMILQMKIRLLKGKSLLNHLLM